MICLRCGRIVPLECSHLKEFSRHIRQEHGFLLEPEHLILYGYCSQCGGGLATGHMTDSHTSISPAGMQVHSCHHSCSCNSSEGDHHNNENKLHRLTTAITIALTAVLSLSGCSRLAQSDPLPSSFENLEDGKLKVAVSFYPMYDFASKIGADQIDLINLVPSGTEPHDWEPSASDLTNLEKLMFCIQRCRYGALGRPRAQQPDE